MNSSSRLARNQFTIRETTILVAGLATSFWIDQVDILPTAIRGTIENWTQHPLVLLAIYYTANLLSGPV